MESDQQIYDHFSHTRRQAVFVNDVLSDQQVMYHGKHQGSDLSPLLLVIYINHIFHH